MKKKITMEEFESSISNIDFSKYTKIEWSVLLNMLLLNIKDDVIILEQTKRKKRGHVMVKKSSYTKLLAKAMNNSDLNSINGPKTRLCNIINDFKFELICTKGDFDTWVISGVDTNQGLILFK